MTQSHASPQPAISHPQVPTTATSPQRSRLLRKWLPWSLLLLSVTSLGAWFALRPYAATNVAADDKHAETSAPEKPATPTAKVVLPKQSTASSITVEQLANVEPYYRAELRARASGIVKSVKGDIGDKVLRGDEIVIIDVPDSEQDVEQKKALIVQRERELDVSKAKLEDARAARAVSVATIKQREADVQAAQATRDLRKRRFERFKQLAQNGTVVGSVIEEEERDFLASDAAVNAALANVERARADLVETESRIQGAVADTTLKEAQIEVARKDLDRARVVLEFGKVVAPFDGVIVRRNVDPGSFVQNATTGSSETLVSVSRVDLVTVVAKFPDSAAPQIAKNVPAIVQIDDLAGVSIPCKVTRFAPSIQDNDRTMRVEIDLFNGDEDEYQRVIDSFRSTDSPQPPKGLNDPIPERAFPAPDAAHKRLLPGMTGKIKLSLGGSGQAYVLPTTAVYSRSGANYVLQVENGKTRQLPVRIHLNDGKVVHVSIISKIKDASGNSRELLQELKGTEQIVIARQLEFGDGATVQSSVEKW